MIAGCFLVGTECTISDVARHYRKLRKQLAEAEEYMEVLQEQHRLVDE